ncbi:MAG: PaaI family thioesterase [Bryobacteraceae bacterium]|nr:PaaI family thioesterase [Solibacteraceae bacterium]MCL4840868.1 PaaI family thioesterase [Bryobacteraceae bacterium]MCO5351752.1 PaaI family thioesterase [Bryobacteraceae bacterium]
MKTRPLSRPQLTAMLGRMPFNDLLGLRVVRVYQDGLTMEMDVTPRVHNILGTLHGGATATLIDAAVGVAIIGHFGGQRQTTTVDMKLNYLRPVAAGKVRARSRFIKLGKTLVVSSCEVKDAHGHLIATALVTYMLL